MRVIRNNFEDKARLVADISDFISALEHPLEREDDEEAALSITIHELGQRVTRLYSTRPSPLNIPPMCSDGTIKEMGKLFLDKETRNCIVDGLKKRLESLRYDIRGLI